MNCLACKHEDARTRCGGLLCHDCEEDGATPTIENFSDIENVARWLGVTMYEVIGAALPPTEVLSACR